MQECWDVLATVQIKEHRMTNQQSSETGAVRAIEESIRHHVKYSLGKAWRELSTKDLFTAVALSVRDRMVERMLDTEERYRREDPKCLAYLSIEFLLGQSLGNNLINLGMREPYRQALQNLGADLAEIEESEDDAALGNGGLGRLAACFLDSLATLGMPAYGYGIHYEYGLFKQEIDNGDQREKPDNWLANGTPWEIARPDEACLVPIYGRIEHGVDRAGGYNPMWLDWKLLVGIPHDLLIPGYGGRTVNRLRLYAARASRDFDMQIFNDGDYFKAVEQKISSETISKVLYPSDAVVAGRELRLMQEYFLVACAVRDIVRRYEQQHATFREFAGKVAIQLNDTHPALAVAELMRLLVDEKRHGLGGSLGNHAGVHRFHESHARAGGVGEVAGAAAGVGAAATPADSSMRSTTAFSTGSRRPTRTTPNGSGECR